VSDWSNNPLYESVISTSEEHAGQSLVGMDGPSLGRKDAFRNQAAPGIHRIGVVDFEDRNRGPAGPRAPFQVRTIPSEMPLPVLAPRIEERSDDSRFGVDARNIRPFEAVTLETGQGKVVLASRAAVLLGNDVVQFEGNLRELLGMLAVLAQPTCTLPDQSLELLVHQRL
jgi:hypothetical protein